jgi:hypothetical protein
MTTRPWSPRIAKNDGFYWVRRVDDHQTGGEAPQAGFGCNDIDNFEKQTMSRTRLSSVLRLGAFLSALCGLGMGLYWLLPAAPRFEVQRFDFVADGLSADGTIVVGGFYAPNVGNERRVSICTLDANTGAERGEFFRGLVGTDAVSININGGPIGLIGDPDEVGFSQNQMQYSSDRRFCVLLHRQGLALADLKQGHEWPTAIPVPVAVASDAGAARIFRRLKQPIHVKDFRKAELKWKDAIAMFQAAMGPDVKLIIDRDALNAELEKGIDIDEVEIALPGSEQEGLASGLLSRLLSHLPVAADYIVHRDCVEITTSKKKMRRRVAAPKFSPGGNFVVLLEVEGDVAKLHVVECVSGKRIASLATTAEQCDHFGFALDDELLYFFGYQQSQCVFTVWNTRQRQIVHTSKQVSPAPNIEHEGISYSLSSLGPLAPDGVTLAVNHGTSLINLQTGSSQQLVGAKPCDFLRFSPDNKTLIRTVSGRLEVWDVATANRRGDIDGWRDSCITPDSRTAFRLRRQAPHVIAWDLQACTRILPSPEIALPVAEIEFIRFRPTYPSRMTTPDHRYVIDCDRHHIQVVDPATGDIQSRVSFGPEATLDNSAQQFTPDGRLMLSQWNFPASRWHERLEGWFPLGRASSSIVVTEVRTGRVVIAVPARHERGNTMLSDDGRVLMTSSFLGDRCIVSCWDVPGRPSLRYVFGIPAAIGGGTLLILWWLKKRRMQPAKSLV